MEKLEELVVAIDPETGEPEIEMTSLMERYVYESGYTLECIDLGYMTGVKMVLSHPQYDSAVILLTQDAVDGLVYWLLKTLGQTIPALPNNLPITIKRILDQKGLSVKLKKGDKKILKNTMDVLRDVLYHKELKELEKEKEHVEISR